MTAKNPELRPIIDKILKKMPDNRINKREYESKINKCQIVEEKLRLRAEVVFLRQSLKNTIFNL